MSGYRKNERISSLDWKFVFQNRNYRFERFLNSRKELPDSDGTLEKVPLTNGDAASLQNSLGSKGAVRLMNRWWCLGKEWEYLGSMMGVLGVRPSWNSSLGWKRSFLCISLALSLSAFSLFLPQKNCPLLLSNSLDWCCDVVSKNSVNHTEESHTVQGSKWC